MPLRQRQTVQRNDMNYRLSFGSYYGWEAKEMAKMMKGGKMTAGSTGGYKGSSSKRDDSEKGPKNPIDRGDQVKKGKKRGK